MVYLLVSNSSFKFVSINLTTNTLNTNFTFDTLTNLNTQVKTPFVLNDKIYVTNTTSLYASNGIDKPTVTNIPFITFSPLLYNNEVYGLVYNSPYGGEVWKTNGTLGGTTILKDLNPGPEGINKWSPIIYDNAIFSPKVNVNNPNSDLNIYVSKGTSDSTVPILPNNTFSDINTNGSPFYGYNNHLYIYAEKTTQKGLFKIDITQYTLGTNSQKIKKNYIYPNPAKHFVNLTDIVEKIEIYDVNGSLVLKELHSKK